ncbi:MAG TPA: hybrid sensor histidine kinase/response regulator [Gallionellaceae bacterium]|nr:hybrid sensor histidine kinase/response regulator [Gallionellaceae bacterium]
MRLRKLLRLSETHILVEQVRLVLSHVYSSAVSGTLLALLMLWVLSNESNAFNMKLWCAAMLLSKAASLIHGHRQLSSGIQAERAYRIALELMLLNAVEGALWGAMAWAALDNTGGNAAILVIAVTAAAAGAAVPEMSPVLPVFFAFVIPELGAVLSRIILLDDPFYDALALGSLLYIGHLSMQAVNSWKAILSAIGLRFENAELVDQLRIETSIAEAAMREAEHANTAKSKFLAAASHDLRQPIHAQGLFLEALARTDLTPHQRELLSSVRSSSEASGELLNALLDFSRIEAGVVKPHIQSFRLQPLLNKIENELAPQADAKNIVYRSRETLLVVRSDQVLLESILRNLVTNAIRYTQSGGVLVACRQRSGQAVLEIWDTGIGIAPEFQQEVFREFYQLGNPERDRNKGLGLGLAISEGLARTLGHRLELVSKPNRGSVFRLYLPVSTDIVLANHAVMQSRTRVLRASVLVIDDDEIVRDGMLQLLCDWGCECEAVESIEEALAIARLRPPDVIISDYRLRKQRTGVEAIAAVRELLGANLPALLITGDTAPERLREAQASGIPLLHKPVSPGKLYKKLVELQQGIL